jgi:hypothetical protein
MSTSYTPPFSITVPSGGGTDIDIVSSLFEVATPGAGYAIGDVLQKLTFYTGSTVASGTTDTWLNLSTGVVISPAPALSDVRPQKSSGLTKLDLESSVITTKEADNSPLLARIGEVDVAAAPADAAGSFSLLAGIKRLVLAVAGIADKIPVLSNGKLPIVNEPQWVTVEYKLNSALMVIFEKEFNGTIYRQRTWTSTTDAQGVTSYTAGEWA